MCLTKKQPIRLPKDNIGYKWAIKDSGGCYHSPNLYPQAKPTTYKTDAVNIAENASRFGNAEWGFHIFNKLGEAKISRWGRIQYGPGCSLVLLKVKYSKIRATGVGTGLALSFITNKDEPYEIVIAEEMTIIGEVE